MSTLNTMPKQHTNGLSKIVLLLNATLPLICFYFFTQQNDLGILTMLGWIGVSILSIPGILAIQHERWIRLSYWSTLIALLIVIIGTSVNLWQDLLQANSMTLVNHLLTLLFGLLLSSALQMHLIRFSNAEGEHTISEKIQTIFQGPSLIISLIIGMIIVNIVLIFLNNAENSILNVIATKFLTRGIIPPLTLLLFFWGLILITGKWGAIYWNMIKHNTTALHELYQHSKTQKAKNKLLDLCWQQLDSFYTIPKYINWAIPILGFIGTVLGISLATEGLSDLLATSESNYSQLLSEALSPLGIAFDTTLIALTLSLVLTLLQTLVYRWEEKLLSQFEQNPTPSSLN